MNEHLASNSSRTNGPSKTSSTVSWVDRNDNAFSLTDDQKIGTGCRTLRGGVSVRGPSTELVGPRQKGWQSPIDPQLRQAVGQNPF